MQTETLNPPPDFSAVPEALRSRTQWLCWRLEEKPGAKKPAKMPYYASGRRRTGEQGAEADRAALVTFGAAVVAMAAIKAAGIGFAFLPGDGLIGIDMDKMVDADTGEVAPRAQRIIEACASYTEWSPSGNGFHIYVLGETGTAKDNGIGVEMFCGRQFFTVTGRHLDGTPREVAAISDKVLRRLHKTIEAAKGGFSDKPATVVPFPSAPDLMSERERIRSALDAIDSGLGYDDWVRVGMALHAALGEEGLALWDAWSARSEKYPGRNTIESHWKSFKPGAVGAGTLFAYAKQAGWKPARPPRKPSTPSEGPAGTPPKGEGGKKTKRPIDWGRFDGLIDHFVLIYGTDTCFDTRTRLILKVSHLRLAFGADYVRMWLGSDLRRMILPDQLVFEPSGRTEPPSINLFDGIQVQARGGDCSAIIELLLHLCADSAESEQGVEAVVDWALKWLALPLQRLGTKMRSALIIHGPQGAGKNLFFELVAKIYGRYATVVGQAQLESDFNEWASQKLFLIGDEVVARQELFHHKNKLKAFITGETIQINPKGLPLRTETNYTNVVFLSNEHQPLALEDGDRRYFVVYTPPRRNDDLYTRVAQCLKAGGLEAFYHYLLNYRLGDFSAFDIPPMTTAKKDLIELGLKPAERFLREFLQGYLPLPLQVCSSGQLYRAFRRWCGITGERFPPPQEQFSKTLTKSVALIAARRPDKPRPLTLKVVKLVELNGKKAERMWLPSGCAPPDGTTEGEWAGECMREFEATLGKFVGQGEAA